MNEKLERLKSLLLAATIILEKAKSTASGLESTALEDVLYDVQYHEREVKLLLEKISEVEFK